MTKDRCGQDVRRRMTETFEVRHLRALIQSFAFFFHQGAVKLTTKDTKDTKNLSIWMVGMPRCALRTGAAGAATGAVPRLFCVAAGLWA
jgi:hypothetical protein